MTNRLLKTLLITIKLQILLSLTSLCLAHEDAKILANSLWLYMELTVMDMEEDEIEDFDFTPKIFYYLTNENLRLLSNSNDRQTFENEFLTQHQKYYEKQEDFSLISTIKADQIKSGIEFFLIQNLKK